MGRRDVDPELQLEEYHAGCIPPSVHKTYNVCGRPSDYHHRYWLQRASAFGEEKDGDESPLGEGGKGGETTPSSSTATTGEPELAPASGAGGGGGGQSEGTVPRPRSPALGRTTPAHFWPPLVIRGTPAFVAQAKRVVHGREVHWNARRHRRGVLMRHEMPRDSPISWLGGLTRPDLFLSSWVSALHWSVAALFILGSILFCVGGIAGMFQGVRETAEDGLSSRYAGLVCWTAAVAANFCYFPAGLAQMIEAINMDYGRRVSDWQKGSTSPDGGARGDAAARGGGGRALTSPALSAPGGERTGSSSVAPSPPGADEADANLLSASSGSSAGVAIDRMSRGPVTACLSVTPDRSLQADGAFPAAGGPGAGPRSGSGSPPRAALAAIAVGAVRSTVEAGAPEVGAPEASRTPTATASPASALKAGSLTTPTASAKSPAPPPPTASAIHPSAREHGWKGRPLPPPPPGPYPRLRLFAIQPLSLPFWACFIQLIGMLGFNLATIGGLIATNGRLSQNQTDWLVNFGYTFGGAGFTLSGLFLCVEASGSLWRGMIPTSRSDLVSFSWHAAFWNLLGSAGFLVGGAQGYAHDWTTFQSLFAQGWGNVGGAFFFLFGAIATMLEAANPAHP